MARIEIRCPGCGGYVGLGTAKREHGDYELMAACMEAKMRGTAPALACKWTAPLRIDAGRVVIRLEEGSDG